MKTITKIAILTAALCACAAAKIQEPPVVWFDDFLGAKLHPGYLTSIGQPASVTISASPGVGGAVMLAIGSSASGVARLRFGEEPVTGGVDARNFSARKNLVYKARVFLNRNTDVFATVGFVGRHDPHNVLAVIFDGESWGFQVANEEITANIRTNFVHTPGKWFTVKIETVWGETPTARLYINDDLLATVEGAYVPVGDLCPEFQLWNVKMESGYSQPTMWIDYLSVKQNR